MKKILILLLISMGSLLNAQDTKKYTPQETVIAFDLHEVVLDYSHSKAASGAYAFLKSNPWLFMRMLFSIDCWCKTYAVVKSTPLVGEALYDTLMCHYPELSKSKSEFLSMLNPHVINPEMAELLQELRQQNYRLAVCSNICEQTLQK